MKNNDKGVYYNTVAELGKSKLFLCAVILYLSSVLLSVIYTIFTDGGQSGSALIQTFFTVYNAVSNITALICGLLLLKIHLSFKKGEADAKALKQIIYLQMFEVILAVVFGALTLLSTENDGIDLKLKIVVTVIFSIFIGIVSLFFFFAIRKTVRLSIAFLEQDIDGIAKYKASIFMIVFLCYTIVYNFINITSSISFKTLLELPALASLILFLITAIKFKSASASAIKKSETKQHKVNKYNL
ncbi:MAG: hypothetical protein IJY88_01110 [Clostridia bacterium]|nr:hypothetical protein [Clostridia bacterium]